MSNTPEESLGGPALGSTALVEPSAFAILTALKASPDGLSRTQVRRGVFQGHRTAEFIDSKLDILRQHGLARTESVTTGGRPAETWFACAGSPMATGDPSCATGPAEIPSQSWEDDAHCGANGAIADLGDDSSEITLTPSEVRALKVFLARLRKFSAECRAERVDRGSRAAIAVFDGGVTEDAVDRKPGLVP